MLRRKKCQKLYHLSLVVGNKYSLTKKHTSLVSVPKSPFMKNVYNNVRHLSRNGRGIYLNIVTDGDQLRTAFTKRDVGHPSLVGCAASHRATVV